MRRTFFSNEIRELYEDGALDLLVIRCREMIRDLRVVTGDPGADIAILLDNIGRALSKMRRYPEAIEATKELLAIDRALFGESSRDYVMDLSSIGLFYVCSDRLDEGKTALDRALELVHGLPPNEQWEHAMILIRLAYLHTERRDFRNAERLLLDATKLRLDDYNWVHPQFGVMFYYLSRLYRKTGKQLAAERSIRKAIRIYRNASYTENSDYARMLAFLGNLQADQRKLPEATESYTEAIEILRRARPPGILEIADIEGRFSQFQRRIEERASASSIGTEKPKCNVPRSKQLFPINSALRRLADAGARVRPNAKLACGGRATSITFHGDTVGPGALSHVACVAGPVALTLYKCRVVPGALARLDGFEGLQKLSLVETPTDDAPLAAIRSLPNVREFATDSPAVTAAGVGFLTRCPRLRVLSLAGTGVGDEGMGAIRHLSELTELYISSTPITDAGLRSLSSLNGLRILFASNCAIADGAVAELPQLTSLQILRIDGTRITDFGVASISEVITLRRLDLSRTQITDAGVVPLAALLKLEMLWIEQTSITDGGLVPLAALPRLGYIFATGTGVTKASRQYFPNTWLHFDGSHDIRDRIIE